MKIKTKWRFLFSFGSFILALSFPVQIMLLYAHPLSEMHLVLQKLTWLNYLSMLSFISLGTLLFIKHRGYVAFSHIAVAIVLANNFWVAQVSEDFSPAQVHFGSFLFLLWAYLPVLMNLILQKRFEQRFRFNEKVGIILGGSKIDDLPAFDISRSGIFLGCEKIKDFYGLHPGDQVSIQWKSPREEQIERQAIVIRMSPQKGVYPQGFALKFSEPIPFESFKAQN